MIEYKCLERMGRMKITARKDDSLWLYSVWFEVPLTLIIDANPEITNLMIGQQVEIPAMNGMSTWSKREIHCGK